MRFSVSTDDRVYSVQVPWWLLAAALLAAVAWQPAAAWASHQFDDVPDSYVFHDDIDWMAANGVTVGCNPPDNTRYCPDGPVTRGQMAAFMHRLDSRDVFTTFAEVESMVGSGTTGPIDADTLDGTDSAAFATDAEVASLLSAVKSRLATLEALLAGVSRDGDTLRFAGMNVQVVDGTGDTDGATNGLGNLIVGYNEDSGRTRGGSHNLVVGDGHGYSSYGTFVAGRYNRTTAPYASVSGGLFNNANAYYSSVSGGTYNTAGGERSAVTGGDSNTASGYASSVTGGDSNTASGFASSVSGGYYRTVTGGFDWRAGSLFADG